jgi:transposase-like protein
MYVTLRHDYEVRECAVYVILGYDLHGNKDILGCIFQLKIEPLFS